MRLRSSATRVSHGRKSTRSRRSFATSALLIRSSVRSLLTSPGTSSNSTSDSSSTPDMCSSNRRRSGSSLKRNNPSYHLASNPLTSQLTCPGPSCTTRKRKRLQMTSPLLSSIRTSPGEQQKTLPTTLRDLLKLCIKSDKDSKSLALPKHRELRLLKISTLLQSLRSRSRQYQQLLRKFRVKSKTLHLWMTPSSALLKR